MEGNLRYAETLVEFEDTNVDIYDNAGQLCIGHAYSNKYKILNVQGWECFVSQTEASITYSRSALRSVSLSLTDKRSVLR